MLQYIWVHNHILLSQHLVYSDIDLVAVVKSLLVEDMSTWHQDTGVSLLLNKESFLDSCFKTLTRLSAVEQEETVDHIIQDLLADIPVGSVSDKIVEVEPEEAAAVEYCPKKQITFLDKLLGKKCEGNPTTIVVS